MHPGTLIRTCHEIKNVLHGGNNFGRAKLWILEGRQKSATPIDALDGAMSSICDKIPLA